MKVPGLRSLVAKRPFWPCAGWEGVVMGVIFTGALGPLDRLDGMHLESLVGMRRAEKWEALRVGEWVGVSR